MTTLLLAPEKRIRKINLGKSFQAFKESDLNADEQHAVDMLSRVTGESVYKAGIIEAFVANDPATYRQLFREILDQIEDRRSQDLTFKILGYECYNAILKLKP